MNQYIVNEPQAKAINDGDRLLIVEIDIPIGTYSDGKDYFYRGRKIQLPLKQGDEIFIAEEFSIDFADEVTYKADCSSTAKEIPDLWQPASKMTEQQSRFKRKVGEVSVKRVQDILFEDYERLGLKPKWDRDDVTLESIEVITLPMKIDWLKNQGIDYSANPWVALAELKEI